jgi:deoxyribonuclease-2
MRVAALILLLLSAADAQKCVDETGQEVDWWVLYKLPRESAKKSDPQILKDGLGYVVFSSRTAKRGWQLSERSIGDPESPPGRTLSPLYSSKDLLHIFYNDEHPSGNTSFTDGHTKGVVAFSAKGLGFWLVHSVPKYPPDPKTSYGYPHTGQVYGQSFLCVSLDAKKSADEVKGVVRHHLEILLSVYNSKTIFLKGRNPVDV